MYLAGAAHMAPHAKLQQSTCLCLQKYHTTHGGDVESRKKMYTDMVNKYYDLATSFYEYGTCGAQLLGVNSCLGGGTWCRKQLQVEAVLGVWQQQCAAVHCASCWHAQGWQLGKPMADVLQQQ